MNDALERLEALYHDIISAREEEERSDSKMWECLERLGQEMRAEASVRSSAVARRRAHYSVTIHALKT